MLQAINRWWQQLFSRQPKLHTSLDQGQGPIVVLLHGIGRSAAVWQPLVELLQNNQCRVVAFDLLGFGDSPKPDIDYTIDDHTAALLASIKQLRPKQPIVLVGHSMGCLLAVRLARLRPELVKHLVLYEMPLYEGLPEKRLYRLRLEAYFRLYDQIINLKAVPGPEDTIGERLVQKLIGLDVDADTWQPFIRSLKNTIMRQSAAADIRELRMPMDIIYGSRDMLVIRGKVRQLFGEDSKHITAHTIRERHRVTPKASRFLEQRILNALQAASDTAGHSRPKDVVRDASA